jgi:tetratricopeptide (TPR) repeat protein
MRDRVVQFIYIILIVASSSVGLFGQQTLNHLDYSLHYRQGKSYFDAKNYIAAHEEFSSYLTSLRNGAPDQANEKTLAEYYLAMCAIYSMRPEAEVVADRFAANHPEIPQSVKLIKDIGSFFYETGDWQRAIKYLSNASFTNLEWKYKLAVSYFKTNQFKEALELFSEIRKIESEPEYAVPAAYYAGVLHFGNQQYSEAIEDFKVATNDPKYGEDVPTWITSAYLKEQKYKELIAYAEPLLDQPIGKFKTGNIAFILGELQFNEGMYAKAAKSFGILADRNPELLTRITQYKYGYSLFKLEQYPQALQVFDQMPIGIDSLSQSIAFSKGIIQDELNQLDGALFSFDLASRSSYNEHIRHQAYLHKLDLLYRMKKYNEVLVDIKAYLGRYEKSETVSTLASMAVGALKSLADISLVEEWMKEIPEIQPKLKALAQRFAFNKGVLFYNKGDLKNALVWFKKSLEYPIEKSMVWEIRFHQGEILARNKRNSDAIKVYMPLLAEVDAIPEQAELAQHIRLSLAHSFAYITMYDRAKQYFDDYTRIGAKTINNYEDFLNSAEVSVAAGKIADALPMYDKAIALAKVKKDDILLRKAEVLIKDLQYESAMENLQVLLTQFPSSSHVEEANFLQSECLFKTQKAENYTKAIVGFGSLIGTGKSLKFQAPALLYRAQSYEILEQIASAQADYGKIIMEFPKDSAAVDALSGLGDLFSKMGQPEAIIPFQEQFVKYNSLDPSNPERAFETCQRIFAAKRFKEAIQPLQKFLADHPSLHSIEAQDLLANAAYEANEHDLALKTFEGLLKDAKVDGHLRTEVSIKMGNIWLGKNNFGSALGAFIQSLHQGEYGKDSTSLLSIRGVLRTFEAQGKLDSAAYFMGKLPIKGLVDTAYVAGLYIGLGQRFEKASSQIQAKSAYQRASELDANDIGARAQLALARMFRTSGSFSESNEVLIAQFVNEKGRYFNADGLVVGEAFILLAQNFISVKNVAQAKAILQSILKDSDSDEVKAKAKQLFDGLP